MTRNAFFAVLAAIAAVLVLALFGSVVRPHRPGPVGCNVATVRLYGDLYSFVAKNDDRRSSSTPDLANPNDPAGLRAYVSTSDDVVRSIEDAAADPSVKAIVMEVDSPGGSGYAGRAIKLALERSGKPTVALIKEIGASAAYWASLGAGRIFASPLSDVGSIGVTSSYLDQSGYDQQNGYDFVQVSTGPYKDTGNPDKPTTKDDYNFLLAQVQAEYEIFVDDVAEARHLSREATLALADGSWMLGGKAKEVGLVDEVGDHVDVARYLAQTLGEEAVFCDPA